MIAEELNYDQITTKIIDRVDVWRFWFYEDVRNSIRYPKSYSTGDAVSCCFFAYPNETSVITIETLTSDSDGGGLNSNDSIEFKLQYTLSDDVNNPKTYPMFSVDLKNYPHYKIWSGNVGDIAHVFPLYKSFKLSKIPDYKKIRIFNISMRQTKGTEKGNECNLMVNYTHDL